MEICKGNINNFCYVCGQFVPLLRSIKTSSPEFQNNYQQYFGETVYTNVEWAPNKVCKTCHSYLVEWRNGKRESMLFGIPMIWTVPAKHDIQNCYVCANTHTGMNRRKLKNKKYIAAASVQLPQPHSENVPVPTPVRLSPDRSTMLTEQTDFTESSETYSLYVPDMNISSQPSSSSRSQNIDPILITQTEVDFLAANLALSQRKSEYLCSFLKKKHLVEKGVKVTAFRHRQKEFQKYFTINSENTFAFCNNVEHLMREMGIVYIATDWRLFIDSSKFSLKAVLLDKTNTKPAIPVAYSTEMKECYETLEIILQKIDYYKHGWYICCDLKVVNILCGLKGGFPKFYCFICDWDSRSKKDQYTYRGWKDRRQSKFGKGSMINEPLVPTEKILLPPLHIKLGIVKKFLEAVVKRKTVHDCLKNIFPKMSEAKLKAGISKL